MTGVLRACLAVALAKAGPGVLIVLWLGVALPAAQTTATGSLSGVVMDTAGGALPGVTVTVTNGETKRTAVTTSDGGFTFTGLPLGWYRVEAELAGFKRLVLDVVPARTGGTRGLTLHLEVGALSIIDYVGWPPADAAVLASVVAHVTLSSPPRAVLRNSTPSLEWHATKHSVAKDSAGQTREKPLHFWQGDAGTIQANGRTYTGSLAPFVVGQQLIVFLGSDGADLYALPHTEIAVKAGVAQWPRNPRGAASLGRPIAEAMATLKAIADQATQGPGREKELTLKQGLPLPWPGTRLGHSREFDNDIYGLKCSPVVTTGGRVLQWIDRLHVTSGRTFVEPCEELELNQPDSKWPRPAAFADWIFEATMGGDEAYPQLVLRRLALPGWGYQSTGAFCGRFVAYWSLERDRNTQAVELHALVADLLTQDVVARERLGPASIETDNPGAFETPVWDDRCRVATMSGQRYGLPVTRLRVPG